MDNADAITSSTAPLAWHDFLERMRHPSAADFVKSIKSFIVWFSNNAPDPERDSAAVEEFLSNMEGSFRAHSLWAGSSEDELESAGEGLEKHVMTKLFNRAFASLPEDIERDEQLYEKMALIQQFILPENLDIKPSFQNETSWLLAQKELQKTKAPRDKLVCILNCCKAINNLLLNASIASNENPPGADEFLPVLIYVIIKANPPQLHSNLLYIQRYRRQSRLVSEAAYFFTNILSAESFIWNIDAKSISMAETEFAKNMESARALLLGLSPDLESLPNQSNQEYVGHLSTSESREFKRQSSKANKENRTGHHLSHMDHSLTNKPSVIDMEKKGAADLLEEDEISNSFQEYPFLYAHVGDLTVEDVEALLSSYKQLALRHVSLSKGLRDSNLPLPVHITQTQRKGGNKSEDDTTARVIGNGKYYEVVSKMTDGFDGGLFTDLDISKPKHSPNEPAMHSGGVKD